MTVRVAPVSGIADLATRISDDDGVLGNRRRHDRSGANHRLLADLYTRQYGGVCTNAGASTDDRFMKFQRILS